MLVEGGWLIHGKQLCPHCTLQHRAAAGGRLCPDGPPARMAIVHSALCALCGHGGPTVLNFIGCSVLASLVWSPGGCAGTHAPYESSQGAQGRVQLRTTYLPFLGGSRLNNEAERPLFRSVRGCGVCVCVEAAGAGRGCIDNRNNSGHSKYNEGANEGSNYR
jgi:hypothetical protein